MAVVANDSRPRPPRPRESRHARVRQRQKGTHRAHTRGVPFAGVFDQAVRVKAEDGHHELLLRRFQLMGTNVPRSWLAPRLDQWRMMAERMDRVMAAEAKAKADAAAASAASSLATSSASASESASATSLAAGSSADVVSTAVAVLVAIAGGPFHAGDAMKIVPWSGAIINFDQSVK